jgi:hypothetical protein
MPPDAAETAKETEGALQAFAVEDTGARTYAVSSFSRGGRHKRRYQEQSSSEQQDANHPRHRLSSHVRCFVKKSILA